MSESFASFLACKSYTVRSIGVIAKELFAGSKGTYPNIDPCRSVAVSVNFNIIACHYDNGHHIEGHGIEKHHVSLDSCCWLVFIFHAASLLQVSLLCRLTWWLPVISHCKGL